MRGGETQIRRVLAHARDEAKRAKVAALVFVGDAMEENPDALAALAGEVALQGVKAFMFQEGRDPSARRVFSEIARLTGGVYSAFDSGRRRGSRRCCAPRRPTRRAGKTALALAAEWTRPRGSCCRRCGDLNWRKSLARPGIPRLARVSGVRGRGRM